MELSKEYAWGMLLFCAVLEAVWALTMKYTDGFTKLYPSLFCVVLVAVNIYLLGLVFKVIPLNVGYAFWVALGVIGTVIGSYFLFGEKLNLFQGIFLLLALTGVVGLKLTAQG